MENSSRFFANTSCSYYPCHKKIAEQNCLFCYCPLYHMENCPGNPRYVEVRGRQLKDCSDCVFPHVAENYDAVIECLKRG
ncbi:MAG: metal-binding protein [Lachnospiraceae bacterium]|nr:metal-binding protein [Lachnospiraceae bacterium]